MRMRCYKSLVPRGDGELCNSTLPVASPSSCSFQLRFSLVSPSFVFYKVLYDVHGRIQLKNLLQLNLMCLLQWLTMDDSWNSA